MNNDRKKCGRGIFVSEVYPLSSSQRLIMNPVYYVCVVCIYVYLKFILALFVISFIICVECFCNIWVVLEKYMLLIEFLHFSQTFCESYIKLCTLLVMSHIPRGPWYTAYIMNIHISNACARQILLIAFSLALITRRQDKPISVRCNSL